MKNTHLICIDPQNDFCTREGTGGEIGKLYVEGANQDMVRLAQFIHKNSRRINQIHCTLDSHQWIHIAHPAFWINSGGQTPLPFTQITDTDITEGIWMARNPRHQKIAKEYVDELKKNGKYNLTIWPPHCLVGTWGHSLTREIQKALYEWEAEFNRVNFVLKGNNMFTEHYSAIIADVPDENDPNTQLNVDLINKLSEADEIVIAGEAKSHCVANTVRDLADILGDDRVKKMVFLEDTSSSVKGFEKEGQSFITEMVERGMSVISSTDW
ncbi:MAG TPA: isochorismatase family protein [Bacteroidales bacterium]|nr:isochorismatase family protein [Bacteroidales bacterium]